MIKYEFIRARGNRVRRGGGVNGVQREQNLGHQHRAISAYVLEYDIRSFKKKTKKERKRGKRKVTIQPINASDLASNRGAARASLKIAQSPIFFFLLPSLLIKLSGSFQNGFKTCHFLLQVIGALMCLVQMVLGTRDGVGATPFLISGCVCVDLHVNHAYTLVEILLYSK